MNPVAQTPSVTSRLPAVAPLANGGIDPAPIPLKLAQNAVIIGKPIRIRDIGHDEYWLQDRIYENPAILGLGELETVSRERKQSSGGRLDVLLKDPEDNSMYEVEVMLGHTDESHIIRAIEYWDIEKRRWPQRKHFCVLVAEVINRRFFNVIHLLSASIPIIAVQAAIVEADGRYVLRVLKVLDVYEEPEDAVAVQDGNYDESYWREKSPWTVDTAYVFLSIVKDVFPDAAMGFVKYYISVAFCGTNKFWLRKRSDEETLINVWLEDEDIETAKKLLDQGGIQYAIKNNELKFRVKKETVTSQAQIFKQLAQILKDY